MEMDLIREREATIDEFAEYLEKYFGILNSKPYTDCLDKYPDNPDRPDLKKELLEVWLESKENKERGWTVDDFPRYLEHFYSGRPVNPMCFM